MAGVEMNSFGRTIGGTGVSVFTLTNKSGAEARIVNYGGIVLSLKVPDRHGKIDDIVLGYDTLAEYEKANPYFGCLVGRCGNRIANGKFVLNGTAYSLAVNNGANHLHGGIRGFDKVVWDAKPVKSGNGPAVELKYLSKDGEEGYPGNLMVQAVYTLTDKNELRLDFTATTDKATICNLTHHSYFNLAGRGDILSHIVTMPADKFTPIDSGLIPTGEFKAVDGTPFDFRKPVAIGARINDDDEQLRFGNGYDHNWVIRKKPGTLAVAASVYESVSGRVMEVLTTEPGFQFYTGNFLDGKNIGKGGRAYQFRSGFCVEPQHYPDSPNKPQFPSIALKPGETYANTIIYRFSVQK